MAGRVSFKAIRATLISCALVFLCFFAYTLTVRNLLPTKPAFQHETDEIKTKHPKGLMPGPKDAPATPVLSTREQSSTEPIHGTLGLSPNSSTSSANARDEPEAWVCDKEDKTTVSRNPSTVHVSCYPRLFAKGGMESALPSSCRGSRLPAESKPKQHVFFLKTHKTGSLTVTTLLNRYALLHNLSVARPLSRMGGRRHGHRIKGDWSHRFLPAPRALGHYDMITNHLVFNESCVRCFLPEDSILVSIVREPLQRFVSAFYFRGTPKLVPGPDPLLTYLSDLDRWDSIRVGGMLHCTIVGEFGLDFKNMRNLPRSLQNLTRVFHLVMLTEAFDESMVLLRRTLSWKLPEMMYTKFHVGKPRPDYNFTEKQKLDFENRRKEDYVMYRHFRAVFYRKVQAQDESFAEEVRVFRSMRNKVETFCQNITVRPGETGADGGRYCLQRQIPRDWGRLQVVQNANGGRV